MEDELQKYYLDTVETLGFTPAEQQGHDARVALIISEHESHLLDEEGEWVMKKP